MSYVKYPRTAHLPGSRGITPDDIRVEFDFFEPDVEYVMTEKMDGENTTFYASYLHARSPDSGYHASRTWVKSFHASIGHNMPENRRICGENMYAVHSIRYENLKDYFLGFSVWDDDVCLSWDDTLAEFKRLGITPVPEIFRGSASNIKTAMEGYKQYMRENPNASEGFVVRKTSSFTMDEFIRSVAKWVRANHVQTADNWMFQTVEKNGLSAR